MATIYQSNGRSVYDLNGQQIDAQTGKPTGSPASAPATAATAPSAPGALPANATLDQMKAALLGAQSKLTAMGAPAGGSGTGSSTTGGTTGQNGGNTGGVTVSSTGDAGLDQILGGIKGVADNLISTGYTIPSTLQITPGLVSEFLSLAHQVVDPYTQQQISSRLADVNSNLGNLATQYGNNMGQLIQDFGTNLATEQNTAGDNGTAFSGLRGLTENNLAASTNRSLSSLASDTGYNIGTAARAAAADVGSANAGGITLPTLATGSVSLNGGSRGSSGTGTNLSYNYDPSVYTVGNIPSAAATSVNNQENSYLTQYGNLAGTNSNGSRSMSDLVGMVSGLPANYSLPANLS